MFLASTNCGQKRCRDRMAQCNFLLPGEAIAAAKFRLQYKTTAAWSQSGCCSGRTGVCSGDSCASLLPNRFAWKRPPGLKLGRPSCKLKPAQALVALEDSCAKC
ncbi:unnamed protein product [Effrenium voratum]|nr:unnamed protein product [Effrenium voratum]